MSVYAALEACRLRNQAAVMVTIVSVEGSAPRGEGVRMLVTTTNVLGTIGGGALEHAALIHAHELLVDDEHSACVQMREWTLGKALSQCCGGRVSLMFDRIPACDFFVEVFGAGHVGQEAALLLRRLPCIATIHDSRDVWLDSLVRNAEVSDRTQLDIDLHLDRATSPDPGVVRTNHHDENVFEAVDACPAGSHYLVMTHSHERDLEVVEAVLSRGDAAFCGLIASRSKAQAFRSRLSRKGFSDAEVAQLTAPLGARVRTGNTPMEVAIAALADVLDARADARRSRADVGEPSVEEPIELLPANV
jgi:xanthine dehydrogenase accessory factor